PWVFLKTPFNERAGQFSPNGHWVAYMSDQSGRNEIYVRPFVPPPADQSPTSATTTGGEQPVSSGGGTWPQWRPDGTELYFLGPDGQMMAAPIVATDASIEVGHPVTLFATRMYGGGADNGQGRQYDVVRDGRFLVNTVLDDPASPITLLQNWKPPTVR